MRRNRRYGVSVLVGVVVTGGVAAATPNPLRELILLLGIAAVYVVGTAIALCRPDLLWGAEGNWASAAFVGVLTFAGLSLLQGVDPARNFAVAALGWGLAAFGFVAGVAFAHERERDASHEAGGDAGKDGDAGEDGDAGKDGDAGADGEVSVD